MPETQYRIVKIKESEKERKIPGSYHQTEKAVGHEVDSDTIVVKAIKMVLKN